MSAAAALSAAATSGGAAAAAAAIKSGSAGEICVIGAGAAGLVTARHLLRCGLRPTVFDAAWDIGGMWGKQPNHPYRSSSDGPATTWKSLRTNLSRYSCSFSDYPWTSFQSHIDSIKLGQDSSMTEQEDAFSFFFPTAQQVHEYLQNYSNHYLKSNKDCTFRLGCHITKVAPTDNHQCYSVEWTTAPHPSNQQEPPLQAYYQDVLHQEDNRYSKQFDGVVVASGFFSQAAWPTTSSGTNKNGLDTLAAFQGKHLHSSHYYSVDQLYQSSPQARNKGSDSTTIRATDTRPPRVAICGSSFSALEIAVDIATAKPQPSRDDPSLSSSPPPQVISILPSVPWIFPHFIPDTKRGNNFSPVDIVFYQRTQHGLKDEGEQHLGNDPELNIQRHFTLATLLGSSQQIKQQRVIQSASSSSSLLRQPWEDPTQPVFAGISDGFLELVSSGRIQVEPGYLVGCNEDGDLLISSTKSSEENNGGNKTVRTLSGVDTIISATGYYTNLNFLDSDAILKRLEYEPQNKFMPVLLCHDVYHPDLPGLAFVGMYRGPYFAVMELQARLAASQLAIHLMKKEKHDEAQSGDDNLVNKDENKMADDAALLNVSKQIREQQPQPQFPRSDYVGRLDSLVSKLRQLDDKWSSHHGKTMAHGLHGLGDDAPHFRSMGDMVLPVMYQPDLSLAQAVLSDMEENLELRCRQQPHHITSTLLTALVGKWAFQRTLTPVGEKDGTGLQVGTSQSVSGTVEFSLRRPESQSSADGKTEEKDFLLYREDGFMEMPTGKKMEVFREYHYLRNPASGAMELYFVEDGKRAHQFLSLLFEQDEANVDTSADDIAFLSDEPVVWKAKSNHLCVKDMYNANFRIELDGLAAKRVQMEYTVKGPAKDYVSRTILTPSVS